jgi:hypothetical protein
MPDERPCVGGLPCRSVSGNTNALHERYVQEQIVGQGLLEAHHPLLRKPFGPAALAAAVASMLDVEALQA